MAKLVKDVEERSGCPGFSVHRSLEESVLVSPSAPIAIVERRPLLLGIAHLIRAAANICVYIMYIAAASICVVVIDALLH